MNSFKVFLDVPAVDVEMLSDACIIGISEITLSIGMFRPTYAEIQPHLYRRVK